MSFSPPVRWTLLACSVGCWVVGVFFFAGTITSGKQPPSQGNIHLSFLSPSLVLVDSALAQRPHPDFLSYAGGFEEPFKPIREARRPAAAGGADKAAAISPARPKLILKGILLKSNPLSILQDENGKTFILGIGDTLQGQRVASIGKASVTLVDSHGSYDLSVKE